jgi:ELWxxDGT repeat protein
MNFNVIDVETKKVSLLKDINPGSANSDLFKNTKMHNGVLYFQANDGSHGNELWRTDGTEKGTYLIEDLNPGIANANPTYCEIIGDDFYFSAVVSGKGRELYSYSTKLSNSTIEKNENDDLRISPNPFEDYLTIKGSAALSEISIYTIDGKLIITFFEVKDNQVYGLHTLNPGAYLIIGKDDAGKTYTFKGFK